MARIILRDGRVAEFRQARRDKQDVEAIRRLFSNVSTDSLYLRFFHLMREVSDEFILDMIADGGPNGMSLLCVSGDKVIAMGNYIRTNETMAEVAFLVDDRLQGKGLGSLLLEHLAQTAWRNGFKLFEATVLRENYQMLHVFKASGYELMSDNEPDAVHLVLPLVETERTRVLQEVREKLATAASLHSFFHPQTVAVIGASRDPNRLGRILLKRILHGGYTGTVYPVNPLTHSVSSVRSYKHVKDIPEQIDLAIISVPAVQVLEVAQECIEAKVKSVLVISAGFGERDESGKALQQQLVETLRESGCRLIGPNCLGLANSNPAVSLNASFAPALPSPGSAAIASHSGALGIAILDYAEKMGMGVSNFVSLGNKADVSGNDMLQYWEDDPDIKMILLYLESFGNPRKFSQICRRIARNKPIMVVKSARTQAGLSISNTRANFPEPAEPVVDALFRQAGVIRANTLAEMFDAAALLTENVLPRGRRVAIVTNTAGGAVTTVDTLQRDGLEFVAPVINLGYEALAQGYRDVLPQVLKDESVDAVVVLFTPIGVVDEEGVVTAISEAITEVAQERTEAGEQMYPSKPVLANFLTRGDYTIRYVAAGEQRIPVYPFPEQAVHALTKVMHYAEFRNRDQGHVPDLENANPDSARDLIRAARTKGQKWIPDADCAQVLQVMGITPPQASTGDDKTTGLSIAVTVQADPLFGLIMELKSISNQLMNKWDQSPFPSLGTAGFTSMTRIIPLTDIDAADMVEQAVIGEDLSAGVRADLQDFLLRLSRLAEEVPEIQHIELTNLTVSAEGLTAGTVQIQCTHE